MHRYRFYGLFVDSPREQVDASIAFWSQALGATVEAEDESYTVLRGAIDGISLEVQGVDDTARYHVDIETDDVDAEAARLIALGATEVARPHSWRVLRAPGGHLLCVVSVQSDLAFFAAHSRVAP